MSTPSVRTGGLVPGLVVLVLSAVGAAVGAQAPAGALVQVPSGPLVQVPSGAVARPPMTQIPVAEPAGVASERFTAVVSLVYDNVEIAAVRLQGAPGERMLLRYTPDAAHPHGEPIEVDLTLRQLGNGEQVMVAASLRMGDPLLLVATPRMVTRDGVMARMDTTHRAALDQPRRIVSLRVTPQLPSAAKPAASAAPAGPASPARPSEAMPR